MTISEFDVTYCAKEYLLKEGWFIVAYNPPGSQGTFTIPNPSKDRTYRGQTGSESPDIVAFKERDGKNHFLFVEGKSKFNADDVKKMTEMLNDEERRGVFLLLVKGVAEANNIPINFTLKSEYVFVKAHGGEKNLLRDVGTIFVEIKDNNWDDQNIDPKEDIYSKFKVSYFE